MRPITIEDLMKFQFVSDPQLSPDGSQAVYVVKETNPETKKYTSHLYLANLASGEVRRLTTSGETNEAPAWAPDGERLAFVSDRGGDRQIYLLHLSGGEALQLTTMKNGAGNPQFSPDGKLLAFISRSKADETHDELIKPKTEEAKKEEKKPGTETARVIENMRYKSDAGGFNDGRFSHLWLLEIDNPAAEPRQLTSGEGDDHSFTFSPDGQWLVFTSTRSDEPDFYFGSALYRVPTAGGEIERLTNEPKAAAHPSFSPDGQRLAFFGHNLEFANATCTRVWVMPAAGGEATCVTSKYDLSIGDFAMSDLRSGGRLAGPVWSADGKTLYFLASEKGSTNLYAVSLESGEIEAVSQGQRQIYGLSVGQGKAVFASTNVTNPGDLFVFDLETKAETQLTHYNGWLKEVELSLPEEQWFEGAEGWPVQGWLMKPIGFEAGKKYPLVLEIHGGPATMYSWSFFHEFQLLAAQGYGVLYTNPRGSHGYGQRFVNAVRGDYGGNDYNDLMACLDQALAKHSWIDAERLGVTGGSYGGFMTNWIVGQTDRFKAAVTDRSICNWLSFYGVSDIGYFFTEWQIDGNPWADFEKLWARSPLKYVDRVTTPLLIQHSENDLRCPIEQAEQLFIALKRLKRETRLVRYPASNHDLSRTGPMGLRLERLQQLVDWFAKYL